MEMQIGLLRFHFVFPTNVENNNAIMELHFSFQSCIII